MKLPKSVTICEVGTRDGFQIEPEWIRRYPLPDGVRERIPARA